MPDSDKKEEIKQKLNEILRKKNEQNNLKTVSKDKKVQNLKNVSRNITHRNNRYT